MFYSGFFSSLTETIRKDLFQKVYSHNTDQVISTINSKNINVNDSKLIDELHNTLLHAAIGTKNTRLVQYLVNNKSSQTKTNIFNETPLNMAMKNHDENLIKILLVSDNDSNNIKKLTDDLDKERTSHKRTRDDRDTVILEKEILRTENKKLKEDNCELQKTVKTLRQSMKK